MVSKKMFQKHIDNFEKTREKRHAPLEKYLNRLVESELGLSPSKS